MHRTSKRISFAFRLCRVTFAFLVAMTSLTLAQSTATLQGTVTDPSNAAVTNAKVLIHSNSTGVERTTATDSAGRERATEVRLGHPGN